MTQTLLNQSQQIFLNAQYWAGQVVAQAVPAATRTAAAERANFIAQQLLTNLDNRFASVYSTVDHMLGLDGLDNVLAIAAAGNDSNLPDRLYGPRLPSAIEGIVGVAALDRNGRPTRYTNANDIFAPDDGTEAFGGDATEGRSTDGLIGLYVADELPPGVPGGNTHGRAMWAGTSFATPIATGVAARLWAEAPAGTTSAQIRTAIVDDAIPLMQE
jgi:hypothetical protein